MANISDILNRPAEDVEAPKPLPPGSYNCIVKGLPEQGESSKKKTPFLKFALQITSPREDVDEEALTEYGDVVGSRSTRPTTSPTMRCSCSRISLNPLGSISPGARA